MNQNTVKHSDITLHGVNSYGFTVFTCYGLGLGMFSTDARGRDAKRAAFAHFNTQARKTAKRNT